MAEAPQPKSLLTKTCTMMRRVAAGTRTEIKRLKDHADALRTLIKKLKAEPPDRAKISDVDNGRETDREPRGLVAGPRRCHS
jgi:hypothetical protein